MKATETNVLKFIGGLDKVFEIPPFQRNYEWTFEQCKELFDDIESSYRKNKNHYLGNVVFYLGKNTTADFTEVILIDGQQRITTIELLLCAIRDLNNGEQFHDKINSRYLINDTDEEQYKVRLKQTSYDYDSFVAIVEKKEIKNIDSNIVRNYKCFIDLLKNTDISLKDIYDTIGKLDIVEVNLQIKDDLEAIQTIFEKINSTGKPLSPADLIRNYLLLSSSLKEQESLYKKYWVNIEKVVGNDNISLFAKNYLILKTHKDIENSKIYFRFKEFFVGSNYSREYILEELEKYSKYFSWIKNNSCPNNKVNKYIIELNALKTEDVYPLYMYLLVELYEKNSMELEKILRLLADFFIRYRIVAPGGGSGAIRNVVHILLENFSTKEKELTYEEIYHELSNSKTRASRYPDDEDFKEALMKSKKSNHTYGKILLRRIEESETKNIGVPLEKITVEHFMPQHLTDWWKENFGGKEKAIIVYERYLNCIGNLGIMSQGYNSVNSDDSWSKKIPQIKLVQFNVTNEVAKFPEWKEAEICERNNDIANRACKAILPPLPRDPSINLIADTGIYKSSNLDIEISGTTLKDVLYKGESLNITSWRGYFNITCKIAHEIDSEKFGKIVSDNIIHKASSKKIENKKDPIIVTEKQLKEIPNILEDPKKIEDTEYYSEGVLSADRSRFYAKQLMDLYGITDDFSISIENESDEEE